MPSRERLLISLMLIVVLCLGAWASAPVWLRSIGDVLVSASQPVKADAVLVLAGDWSGNRIRTACDILRSGFAPVVLVSGPVSWYDINEADAAIQFAARHGCDAPRLQPLYVRALSTVEEARVIHPILRERGIRNLLIVTSDYHTARSARVYRKELGSEIRFTMVGAPDNYFSVDSWWHTREGQKTVFYEFSKTIAHGMGL